jgi:ABC-type transport system involved in multi-copper enzyme maturation permease subunit
MWTLVRKDLILDRRQVALNFVLYLVMGPVFLSLMSETPVKLIAAWAAIVGTMIPLSLLAREDKFHSARLTCSLPVTRDTVVASRFAGGWILALSGGLAIVAAIYGAHQAGLGNPVGDWSQALLVGLVTIGLILAVLFPFTMRFGFAGLIGFLVFTQVLGIVAFLSVVLVGGQGALGAAIGGVAGALGALQGSFGPVGYDLFLLAAVVALNVASFLASRWIYRRREF